MPRRALKVVVQYYLETGPFAYFIFNPDMSHENTSKQKDPGLLLWKLLPPLPLTPGVMYEILSKGPALYKAACGAVFQVYSCLRFLNYNDEIC